MKPELTAGDWVEIYYALEYKLSNVVVRDDRRWKTHISRIMETIGPDGANMWKAGEHG